MTRPETPAPKTPTRRRGTLAMLAHPRGLWRFLRDPASPKAAKAGVLLAALYVVVPTDLIPDIAPVLGWLDDLGMTAVALTFLASQAARYEVKQLDKPPGPEVDPPPSSE